MESAGAALPSAAHVVAVAPHAPGEVIGHRVVLHAHRASLVTAHAAADLPAPLRCALPGWGVALDLGEPLAQHPQRDHTVLPLRAFSLTPYLDPRRNVRQLNRAVGLLQVLTALSRRTARRPLELDHSSSSSRITTSRSAISPSRRAELSVRSVRAAQVRGRLEH